MIEDAPDSQVPEPTPTDLTEPVSANKPVAMPRAYRTLPRFPAGVSVASVQNALKALESTEKGWLHVLIGLGISLVLFLNVGLGETPLTRLAIITVVILIHEAGHFIGMKVFNYRNVRMFFIPFFGAVVTGENTNPEGWKRATVSLLGPIPGILIGCAVGGFYYFHRLPILSEFAVTFLILNALNLLPFVPLDGGRFFQEVIFSRNRYLEAGFGFLTGGLLALFAFQHQDWALTFVGASIVISSRSKLKIGKLASQQTNQLASSSGDIEVNEALLLSIRDEFPALKSPKEYAIYVKRISEKARHNPPDGWATAGLLLVYAGSFVFMIIAVLGFALMSTYQYNKKIGSAEQFYFEKNFVKAESEYRDALEFTHGFGKEDLRTATALMGIALSCSKQGLLEEAEKNGRHALEIRERILGPDHHKVATVLRFLARCMDESKRPGEADTLRKRADAIDAKSQTHVEEKP